MVRRRVVALLLVVAAAALVGVVVLARRPSKPPVVSPQQAVSSAHAACAAADDLEQLVRRNARMDDVRRTLRRAEDAADKAARGDARWQALAGGVSSLRIGIDANDARATRVGIDVVRAQCRQLG